MKKEKVLTKIFKTLFVLLFIVYITIYASELTGYYEYKNHQKTVLTEEQILSFEDDVKNGRDVSLENYVVNTNKNYQTKLSKLGLKLSNTISHWVNKGINSSFEFLVKLVDE